MVKFVVGFAVFAGICMVSFNYVREHESTAVRAELKEWKAESKQAYSKRDSLLADVVDANYKLRQTCNLLKVAEIENDFCSILEGESEEGGPSDGEAEKSDG